MNKILSRGNFAAVLAASIMAGCGGGAPDSHISAGGNGATAAVVQAQALRFDQATTSQELLGAQLAVDGAAAVRQASARRLAAATTASVSTADEFMDWISQTFTPFFPGQVATATGNAGGISYTYRLHMLPSGGFNMMAITSDGQVYALGELTGGALVQFGKLADYDCAVHPGFCVSNSYAVGSLEVKYFAQLNDARIKGGFGALADNMALAAAGRNHANYYANKWVKLIMVNIMGEQVPTYVLNSEQGEVDPATGWLKGHVETPGDSYFTGILPKDRQRAAGYAGLVAGGEVINSDSPNIATDSGCMDGLLTTVFHRSAMLSTDQNEVGVGRVYSSQLIQGVCSIELGANTAKTVLPANWIGVYPGVGQTGLAPAMRGEAPNPVPEFTAKGQPISLYVAPGHTLAVSSFTLTGPAGAVQVKLLTKADFPTYLGSNEAYIVPNGSLAASTTYTAKFVGTDSGKAVTKTWTFTTRN